jgi:hypothetical protein
MTSWDQDSPSSPHHSWQHALQTEGRLTKLEVKTDTHEETIHKHTKRHDDQDIWNKAFTIALAGLSAGLAHAKASDLLDLALSLLQRLKT